MTTSNKQQIRPVILAPTGIQAEAAIYIVDDQFLFHGIDGDGREQIKFVSPASVREAFAKEPLDSGWLPPGVNRCGTCSKGQWMVRWHNPMIVNVYLDGRKTPLRVPMPSLIWFGIKNNYYIFAAKENGFKPNAALYRAPLANVNHHGLICFGDNEHPDVARAGFDGKGGLDLAWKVFWGSKFNNDHDDGKSKKFPNEINKHLLVLAKAKVVSYPLEDLVSMNIGLDAAIHRLTRRGNETD